MVAFLAILSAIPWSMLSRKLLLLLALVGTMVFMVLYVLGKNDIEILKASSSVKLKQISLEERTASESPFDRLARSVVPTKIASSGFDPAKGLSKFAVLPGFTSTNPFDRIDRVYYINMDHRKDRLHEISQECVRMGIPKEKIQRVPGVKDKFGALGCSKAHLNALTDCYEKGYKNCIVLEDDFMFKYNKEFTWEQLNRFWASNVEWDVVMLSSNTNAWENTSFDFLLKVVAAQTTGGYMVNRAVLDELRQNIRDGIDKLEADDGTRREEYCIDQYWKSLQPARKWYVFNPIVGHQRDTFSDIQKVVTDYADKRELVDELPQIDYLIVVQTCVGRAGKYDALLASLKDQCKSAPMCFYQYRGDPNLQTDYSVDEVGRMITLKCKDDYLNLCHKYGQLTHALQNLILINKRFKNLKGVLCLDDDVSVVGNVNEFLNRHSDKDYFGVVTSMEAPTTNFLKRKAAESKTVNAQMQEFPGLLKYDMQIHTGKYCAGPAYFVKTDLISILAHSNDLFLPFPDTQEVLDNYLITTGDGQSFYSNEVSVMEDSNVGACLMRVGVAPENVDMKHVIVWK